MSETATLPQEQKVETSIKNPFSDDSWASAPIETKEPPAAIADPPPIDTPKEDGGFIDADEYLRTQLGYDNWDTAKSEIEKLRQAQQQAQTPAEIKFADDESRKFFDYIKGGDRKSVREFLNQQDQLERLEKLELTKVEDAAEIIKANLQFKHKDLSPKEIEFLFNKKYSIPKQPSQSLDENDEDYTQRVESWKSDVQEKEQEMIIEAKLAKPEFAKYKSELILPDIQKIIPQQQEPDQKSLEDQQAQRDNYLKQLELGYKNFNGFETKVKDESVEIPVSFNVPEEEKVAYYNKLKEFDVVGYFGSRWFNEKGEVNAQQAMSDLYLLENPGKVFQGMANNSASKRLDEYLKVKSNIKVDGTPQGTFKPDAKDAKQKEADTIWDA